MYITTGTIRKAAGYEVDSYRNLALNPFDQHEYAGVYPHASANVETRGEAVFVARNAIDGVKATLSHGEWPYESWGINRQDDAFYVTLSKMKKRPMAFMRKTMGFFVVMLFMSCGSCYQSIFFISS